MVPTPRVPVVPADRDRWWLWLGLVCAGALAVRVGYLFLVHHPLDLGGDPYQYHHGANLVVDGKGFVDAFAYNVTGELVQTAQHPPLHYLVLAIPSVLGLGGVLAHQLWTCLIGTATVAVVALVGRRLSSPRAGLAAAALAAVYPNLWVFDGTLWAETTSLLSVALVLLAAYRLWARRSVGAAVALGLACAVAALTRAEALLLLPLIVVPMALTQRSLDLRQRVSLVVLPALAALALLAPWLAFNAARFDQPVMGTSTGFPLALVQANCDATYYGSFVGYWAFGCIPTVPDPEADETEQAEHYRRVAVEYVRANAERVPTVILARLGRTFGLYQPFEQVRVDIYVDVRQPLVAWSGLATYYLLVAGAVIGAGVLYRRGVPLSPMVAVVAIVLMAVALTSGQTRLRSSAEVALVLLAGVAIDDLLSRWRATGGVQGASEAG
jgi:4-amino-4-deoxy-L-arabinose transferase-like glycosyltransferase